MYSFNERIRYSELGENGELSLVGLLNLFQDCSTFQSEDLGLGIKYLQGKKEAWWVNSWQIDISRLPGLAQEVEVGTFAYNFKSFYGYRNFFLKDENGEFLVKADSIWFHYDLDNKRPTKPTDEALKRYLAGNEKHLDITEIVRKFDIPTEYELGKEIVVSKNDLDTNHHMNNAVYVSKAKNIIEEDFKVKKISVQYKKAAVLNDVILPRITKNENSYIVNLADPNGDTYAIVRFEY